MIFSQEITTVIKSKECLAVGVHKASMGVYLTATNSASMLGLLEGSSRDGSLLGA